MVKPRTGLFSYHWRVWIWATVLFLLGSVTASAGSVRLMEPDVIWGGKRIALVIGNANYKPVTPLANTLNDATAVALKAQNLGYRVYLGQDLDRLEMNRVLNDFLSQVAPESEVLLFYSGHGVEVEGTNYLLPVDVPNLTRDEGALLRSEAIALANVLEDIAKKNARVSVVILDACRDNPFKRTGEKFVGSADGGLAVTVPPRGVFIIYAAGNLERAIDRLNENDTNQNGVFTRFLLTAMEQDGLELRTMTRQLQSRVIEAARETGRSQTPSYYDQLIGDFYFKTAVVAAKPVPIADQSVKPVQSERPVETECDRLAADPDDSRRLRSVAGVNFLLADRGLDACRQAVVSFPQEPRFQFQLGRAYEASGDFRSAETHYKRAADAGYGAGFTGLGDLERDGSLGARDYREAFRLYERAAEQGDSGGINRLAYRFYSGTGTKQDYSKAFEQYQRCANLGNAACARELGLMYRDGRAVRRNIAKAMEFFHIAAEKGEPNALLDLSSAYGNGTGVTTDYRRSARYLLQAYRKGASRKNADNFLRNSQFPRELTRFVQSELKAEGIYSGQVDGKFGPATSAAVQSIHGTDL